MPLQIKKPFENQRVVKNKAVWTGLEPATPCVTGRYSNQTELPDLTFNDLLKLCYCTA